MNKLLSTVIVIICIIVLAISYVQWKGKLDSVQGIENVKADIKKEPVTEDKEEEPVTLENEEPTYDTERLLSLTTNQDEQIQKVFQNRLEANKQLNFLVIGSSSLLDGDPGYADRLTLALNNAYGDFIQVTTETIEGTTAQFISDGMNLKANLTKGYDVVLFEPLTLNNNGIVVIEDEHKQISAFRDELRSHVEDVALVLHPPQPLYAATYYPTQVNALQAYAERENIPFVNHWAAWPETSDEKLKDFLTEDSAPNSDGAEVWANALIDYFIAK